MVDPIGSTVVWSQVQHLLSSLTHDKSSASFHDTAISLMPQNLTGDVNMGLNNG